MAKCVICYNKIKTYVKKYHSGKTETYSDEGILYHSNNIGNTGKGGKWLCKVCWDEIFNKIKINNSEYENINKETLHLENKGK